MSYTISQMANATGITVSKLRLFDRQGLVVPMRLPGNLHRVYEAVDVQRLQRMLTLSKFGLTAPEMRRTLDARLDVRTDSEVVLHPDQVWDLPEPINDLLLTRFAKMLHHGSHIFDETPQRIVAELVVAMNRGKMPGREGFESMAAACEERWFDQLSAIDPALPSWFREALLWRSEHTGVRLL